MKCSYLLTLVIGVVSGLPKSNGNNGWQAVGTQSNTNGNGFDLSSIMGQLITGDNGDDYQPQAQPNRFWQTGNNFNRPQPNWNRPQGPPQQTESDDDNVNSNSSGGCQLASGSKANFNVIMNVGTNIPKGQCTEWADGRYYQITGTHAVFNGDAHLWNDLARSKPGWTVSNTPSFPSIVVIEQYTNGAAQYGHVAVVEKVNPDGSFCTSNWNSPGLGRLTMKTMRNGSGISFIKYGN